MDLQVNLLDLDARWSCKDGRMVLDPSGPWVQFWSTAAAIAETQRSSHANGSDEKDDPVAA